MFVQTHCILAAYDRHSSHAHSYAQSRLITASAVMLVIEIMLVVAVMLVVASNFVDEYCDDEFIATASMTARIAMGLL